ncbi:MAG: hypothetical protein A2096_01905 [Spirochaetes bacterium GWF1_41_5]|nr:MAG: hypothetical protein A2096_01905 [Spirochaetes bacterium GWF1_41_5]
MQYCKEENRYMLAGDFHVHTDFSDGDWHQKVVVNAVNAGLDFLTITDHDTAKGASVVREYCAACNLPLVIITGSEITGPGCHLLSLGIEDEIVNFPTVQEIAQDIRQKGGYICAAHPCWTRTKKFFWDTRLFHDSVEKNHVDGMELINYSANKDEDNGNMENGNIPVIDYYRTLAGHNIHFPVTAGSDAHKACEIGHVYTVVFSRQKTAASILEAVFKDNLAAAVWKHGVYGSPEALRLYEKYSLPFETLRKASGEAHIKIKPASAAENSNFIVQTIPGLHDIRPERLMLPGSCSVTARENTGNTTVFSINCSDMNEDKFVLFSCRENSSGEYFSGALMEIEKKIKLSLRPFLENGEIKASLEIYNYGREALKKIKAEIKINGNTEEHGISEIAVQNSRVVKSVNTLPDNREKNHEISCILSDASGKILSRETALFPVLICPADNFDKKNMTKLASYRLKDSRRDDDTEVSISASWTDENLIIRTLIKDNYFFQPFEREMLYLGDSIQLGLDPGCGRSVFNLFSRDVWELGLSLSRRGPEVFVFTKPQTISESAREIEQQMNISITRSGNIFDYRLQIPWRILQLTPRPGTVMGFSLIVNINDGKGRRGWVEWTPGIADRKRAADWGWLVLE